MTPRIALAALLLAALPAAAAQRTPLAGGTCGTPTVVSTIPYTDTGTTVGGTDTVTSVTCTTVTGMAGPGSPWGTAGPDVVYAFSAGASNSLTIQLVPAPSYDPAIYVLTTCGTGTTCSNGADAGATGATETISAVAFAAGTHYLYVDSHYSATDPNPSVAAKAAGTYTVNVSGTLPAELIDFTLD